MFLHQQYFGLYDASPSVEHCCVFFKNTLKYCLLIITFEYFKANEIYYIPPLV